MDLIKQRFGGSEFHKWFVTKARFGYIFRIHVSPTWLAQGLPQIVKIPRCLDLIDCTMVLPIATCKFYSKNIPDAFKHVPDLF